MVRTHTCIALLVASSLGAQPAQRDTSPVVTIGAFIDTYFAWDRNRPSPPDRAITTAAARHNEFNVNLAHLSLDYAHQRVRARATMQAGTSVQANYASEPTDGVISGPAVSRIIQEAFVGVNVRPSVEVDAGIFFSPIGHESWISADNPTYTRSLTADFTPYYVSGVRGRWEVAERVTTQLQLVNGWQTISERNGGKALIARIDVAPHEQWQFGVVGYVGDDRPRDVPARRRAFGQLLAHATPTRRTELWGTIDRGREGDATWWSATVIARQALTETTSLSLRAERYRDPRGVQIPFADGSGGPTLTGVSGGIDIRIPGGALWRVEARMLDADQRFFPSRRGARATRDNALLVTALTWKGEQRVR
jgi:hypothetical protein